MSINGGTVNDCAPSILKQTIDNHLDSAELWGENLPANTDPMQMIGWRPTSYVLAQEVRRLRAEAVGPLYLVAQIREAIGDPHGRLMQDELISRCRQLKESAGQVGGLVEYASHTGAERERLETALERIKAKLSVTGPVSKPVKKLHGELFSIAHYALNPTK